MPSVFHFSVSLPHRFKVGNNFKFIIMSMNKEQENALLEKLFKVSNLSTHFSDEKIKGYYLTVFLKDEEAVDKFSEWFKKEILKINI